MVMHYMHVSLTACTSSVAPSGLPGMSHQRHLVGEGWVGKVSAGEPQSVRTASPEWETFDTKSSLLDCCRTAVIVTTLKWSAALENSTASAEAIELEPKQGQNAKSWMLS